MVQEATACCSQISCEIKKEKKNLQISASLSISARYGLFIRVITKHLGMDMISK